MPPKPARGRGAPRARGGSRGGASAGRSSANASDNAPLATSIGEPLANQGSSVVAKVDENTRPHLPVEGDSVVGDAQSPSLASSSATPHDVAHSPSRPPVQRLGSLNPSRSASPAVRRGASTRGKRGAMMPPVSTRRSKEERASREKEFLSREKERTREQEYADKRKKREAENAARRRENQAQRSRGGMSGAMSGPFSLGSSRDDRKVSQRPVSGFGGGSGSRASRVKDEDDIGHSGGGSGGSGWNSRSSGGPAIKREGGSVESDEDEEIAEFPRKDIDAIYISSDENEGASSTRPQRSVLPVRIGRKEHQERTIGINTDSSAETAVKGADSGEGAKHNASSTRKYSTNKGKGKAAALDMTNGKKPFKGVWDDPEELASPVKTEQNSEDEAMADAESVGISQVPTQATTSGAEPLPETERKSKGRIKGVAEPVLQTDEDRAEWERFQKNLSHIRAELGPDDSVTFDNSGGVNMEGVNPNSKQQTVRDNNVYLFQIPPLMPELLQPGIKKEPTDEEPVASVAAPAAKDEIKVKVEEGFSDPSAKTLDAPRFASGLVGKVRVRQSGRTTLDWGGTSYELTPGNKASFLQEVVSMQVVTDDKRVVPEGAGEATSLGRVKGKFVVVPDWNQMLG